MLPSGTGPRKGEGMTCGRRAVRSVRCQLIYFLEWDTRLGTSKRGYSKLTSFDVRLDKAHLPMINFPENSTRYLNMLQGSLIIHSKIDGNVPNYAMSLN